jgi:hypothetical protein
MSQIETKGMEKQDYVTVLVILKISITKSLRLNSYKGVYFLEQGLELSSVNGLLVDRVQGCAGIIRQETGSVCVCVCVCVLFLIKLPGFNHWGGLS